MVQANDDNIICKDILPKTLDLLNEMNSSTQHVALMVNNMIQKVRNGEISTDKGLTFLEIKYNILLSYLINLTYIILRKCSGETINNGPCIMRLVEIRTILEKIRPINMKLKYQIDKLVNLSVCGLNNDMLIHKANPTDIAESKDDLSSSEDSDIYDNNIEKRNSKKSLTYEPPKISAVHFIDNKNALIKHQRFNEKKRKQSLNSLLINDLKEQYFELPSMDIIKDNQIQSIRKKQQRIINFEEENMTRLPISKNDKHKRRKLITISSLGEEVIDFENNTKKKISKRKKN